MSCTCSYSRWPSINHLLVSLLISANATVECLNPQSNDNYRCGLSSSRASLSRPSSPINYVTVPEQTTRLFFFFSPPLYNLSQRCLFIICSSHVIARGETHSFVPRGLHKHSRSRRGSFFTQDGAHKSTFEGSINLSGRMFPVLRSS